MSATNKPVTRFPLLIYQAPSRKRLTQSVWLLILGVVLWGYVSFTPNPKLSLYGTLGLVCAGIGLFNALYALMALGAHIHCRPKYFSIRGPLYTVNFSYSRVDTIRPVQFNSLFPPEAQKAHARRDFARLWAKTAIVVDLKSYPISAQWLRFWFGPYLLLPKANGLVLVTEDWMALSRQLETGRAAWIERRTAVRSKRY